MTRRPPSSRSRTRWLPMKPAAPVTSTAPFTMASYQARRQITRHKMRASFQTTLLVLVGRGLPDKALDDPPPGDNPRAMDDKHYRALLEAARVSQDGPWALMTEERTITLHVASGGVG